MSNKHSSLTGKIGNQRKKVIKDCYEGTDKLLHLGTKHF